MSGNRRLADPAQVLAHDPAALLYEYARLVDARDLDGLAALTVPDVRLTRIDGTHHGRDAFLQVYRDFAASGVLGSKHLVTNLRTAPEEPGGIRADAYYQAVAFLPDATRLVFGEYSDSLVEVDGRLLFAHKRITIDRVVTLPASTAPEGPHHG